ncbi:MAG TPA: endonuclease/exonuclease/phosphatase family protein [Candidatus Saccharimonadales bacterium]|nr:endonuclease/exonuclease/phosphatase family protein [Candidatus Saccharimonadales bacterium]
MRLLQLNAWGGRLEKQILDLINKEQPDILCLQEAVSLPGGSNGGLFLTVEEMKSNTGMNLSYAPVFSFKYMKRNAAFGNAILSKQKYLTQQTLFTNLEHKDDFDFATDDYNIRNLLHVSINYEGEQLHVLTHHGHHVPHHKQGDADSLRQCRQIAEYIKGLKGKIILTGDFNLEPDSASIEQLNEILTNLSLKYNLSTTRTQLTHKTEVCDYIFVSNDIDIKSFRAPDDIVSDHKALVLDFA